MKDIKKTIEKLIDNSTTTIISSVDEDGFPSTKAMLKTRKREGLHTIYFSTNTSSKRVSQFRKNNKACIYYYDSKKFKGVMLIGTMEVLEDELHKKMLWQIGDRIYYPKGVSDPDYCILKFTGIKGRYYSNMKSVDFKIEELCI